MRVGFLWLSSRVHSGGSHVLHQWANGLARRGHEVHFLHGPGFVEPAERPEDIPWADFHPEIIHAFGSARGPVDEPEGFPTVDVFFSHLALPGSGLQIAVVQGHKMLIDAEIEVAQYRAPIPKLCVATWLLQVGRDLGVPDEQLIHVPIGIEHETFHVAESDGERPVDVAVVAHDHPRKGWSTAVRTLEILRRRRPDLVVEVFAVRPPMSDVPDWMRTSYGLDREGLAAGLNRAKTFLQTSWLEGFGITAVEGMACGAALVTTDNGGSADYAIADDTAIVVPPGDADGLATAVGSLLDDPARRAELAARGAEMARTFTWERSLDRLEAALEAYVAEPDRFQQLPAPRDDVPAPTSRMGLEPDRGTVPGEHELTWNVVWVGASFESMYPFMANVLSHTTGKLRFIANGCGPEQVEQLRRFRAAHPGRVVEVFEMPEGPAVSHGRCLDLVREQRYDGPWFCLLDPDILFRRSLVADLIAPLADVDVVTSGTEIWSDDNVIPDEFPGVAGEFFFGRDGFVFGSPHLAVYRRPPLDDTCRRWHIGFGSGGADLTDDARARLAELGQGFLVFDTGKLVNIFMQADGAELRHHDLDDIVHIGGLVHYLAPPGYRETADGESLPDWAFFDRMEPRFEVARYPARLLRSLLAGATPPPMPDGLDPSMQAKLELVRREITELVADHGRALPPPPERADPVESGDHVPHPAVAPIAPVPPVRRRGWWRRRRTANRDQPTGSNP